MKNYIKSQLKNNKWLRVFSLPAFCFQITLMMLLIIGAGLNNQLKASHGVAPVSDIDHVGMGTFSGSYTHSGTDHVWFVFNATAGDVINVSINTPGWQSYAWTFFDKNGKVEVGDSEANGKLDHIGSNGPFTNGSYSFTATCTGQYAIQLDSYLSGSGNYTVTISGATNQMATFNYTGAFQTWVVPANVYSILIESWGAEGANAIDRLPGNSAGGLGGYAKGLMFVTPGQTLYINVGGAGSTSGAGGFNGGGNGGNGQAGGSCFGGPAGGGGGASDVRLGTNDLINRKIVGAGGGGAGRDYCNGTCQPCGCGGGAGGGGGLNGINGASAYDCGYNYPGSGINGGSGGTQGSGGAGGPGDNGGASGSAGTSGFGGIGADGLYDVAGGGGGGGYYGGGGGGGAINGSGVGGGGGAGGSSYIGMVNGGATQSAIRAGNGMVKISYVQLCNVTVICRNVEIRLGTPPVTINALFPEPQTMAAQTKGVAPGVCPNPATAGPMCNCPDGYVVVGYEGWYNNGYGGHVISSFRLKCREVMPDGNFGSNTAVTCYSGSLSSSLYASVNAGPDEVLVGFRNYMGCAVDGLIGRSKSLSSVLANSSNGSHNVMPTLGGIGGGLQPMQLAPDGHVIVGMQTYYDSGNGISAGYAWKYAKLNDVMKGIASVIDDCGLGISSSSLSQSTFNCSDIGVNVENVNVANDCYSMGQCNFNVSVSDVDPPTIECPDDVMYTTAPGDCGPVPSGLINLGSPAIADNCPGATPSNNAPAAYNLGNTNVKWKATDASGNMSPQCIQKVTIKAGSCGQPIQVYHIDTTHNSAKIKWKAGAPCNTGYQLRIRKELSPGVWGSWSSWDNYSEDPTLEHHFTFLMASSYYHYQIRSRCGITNSTVVNGWFHTVPVPALRKSDKDITEDVFVFDKADDERNSGESTIAQITAIPNPATDFCTLQLQGFDSRAKTVTMLDLFGKMVFKVKLPASENNPELDLQKLNVQNGAYLFHVDDGQNRKTVQLIIQR